jgi:cyclomaltodextrinase / maltogenic alpha-amylase / neopullulanase
VMMKTPAFYSRNAKGEIVAPVPDWADVADLNYDKPELRKYMIDVLKFWVREYDLDGFRCDVAGFVPTDFWETARAEVDKVKADTIWLAEWESPDLLVKAFNLDYSWAMHSALDKVMHGQAPASEIRRVWEDQAAKYPRGSLRMRFSDNHDESRSIARFGEKGALAAQALVFTLDGVPMLYNGMEAGDTTESGAPALFEKRPIFWQFAERRQDFPRFYSGMIALRKNSLALRRGSLTWVKNSDETRVLTFTRKAGNEEILVAVNMGGAPLFVSVDVAGDFEEITPNTEIRPAAMSAISLESWGYRIFRKK